MVVFHQFGYVFCVRLYMSELELELELGLWHIPDVLCRITW